ncbi:MAG: phosphoenolpyruvate carboxylase [Hyphomonadaceae bacterium]
MAKAAKDAAALKAWCLEVLAREPSAALRDPLSASVRTLAVELLARVNAGELDVGALRELTKAISDEALAARGARLKAQYPERAWRDVVHAALAPLRGASLDELKRALESPRVGAVFTGHPTFAMSRAMRAALGALASGEEADLSGLAHLPDAPITLRDEHADAGDAITRGQNALRHLASALFDWLEANVEGEWWTLNPAPVRLATWVGYDLDGRTDIHWGETIRIRLEEKARQLARYAEAARDAGADALHATLSAARDETRGQEALFNGDLDDPKRIVEAANRLTAEGPKRLTTLAPLIAALDVAIAKASGDKRKQLCVLRAEMRAFGLGVADIHLRVNAAQVRSAVQADLGLTATADFFDRRAMTAAAERAATAREFKVNFASIFREQKTARRQMMLSAEILKHIDADRPIRFLIAEIESPATIMGAIYLARLYGVDEQVDISPLFETPDVLERGGRFMERLLDEPEYVAYIRRRGRMSIQFGFSDSGRFMGQIAADLAIERIHVLISRALAARGIRDVDVLLFNTHGESMGRGAFPGTIEERLDHLLTPWSRGRFARDGLRLQAEVSFQGGDGYMHFQTQKLADAAIASLLTWSFAPTAKPKDCFYDDINFSWDVYRGVKGWQEALFADRHYQAVLGSFGPNLLPGTGSRKTRRQSGASKDDVARSLRAIPHNAILQQLAAPANVSGGLGHVAAREPERFSAHVQASERLSRLMRMANNARRLTSLSVMRTYAHVYSPSFWTVQAARDGDDLRSEAALRIAERLEAINLDVAIERLANFLSGDRRRFDAVSRDFLPATMGDQSFDANLYVLHAVRLVFMVQGFMLAAATPQFSPRHDMTREDLLDLALELRFVDVADALTEIFPRDAATPEVFAALREEGEPESSAGYPEIARNIAEPLRVLDAAIKEITVGASHFYGAFG